MTNPLKKNRERFFVKKAAELMGKTWSLGLDREYPDFLVTEGTQQFGLEVSEIFTGRQNRRGSEMREMEAQRQKAIDALRSKYEAIENIPLMVEFLGDVCPENLALVVPALVAKNLTSVDFQTRIDFNALGRAGLRVRVTRNTHPNWFSGMDRSGFIDLDPMQRIAVAVEKKSENLPRIRQMASLFPSTSGEFSFYLKGLPSLDRRK